MSTSAAANARAAPRADAGAPGTGRRWWVLAAVAVAWFLVLADDTAVAIALPPMGRELGLGLSGLEWVVNLYTLTFAAATLCGGMLADRYGRRRLFLTGLIVFALFSLAAAAAPSGAALIALRAGQGAGAALMGPAALALLLGAFAGRSRALALGVWSGVGAAALAGGPLVGALLTAGPGWRSIFWINAPLGALVWAVSRRALPAEPPPPRAGRLDIPGAAASAAAMAALVYALTRANSLGWSSITLWALLAGAAFALILFALIERRASAPLLDPALLRRANFLAGNLLAMTTLAVMCSVFFFLSLYLQLAAGASALRAGLALLPLTLLGAAVAPAAGYLVPRVGARALISAGLALTCAGLLILAGIAPGWAARQLQPGLLITGLGLALATTPITTAALGEIPERHAGAASAALSAFRTLGLSLGIAVMGAIVAAQWPGDLIRTRPTGAAFTRGIADGLRINAAIAAAAAILAVAAIRHTRTPRQPHTAPATPAPALREEHERR